MSAGDVHGQTFTVGLSGRLSQIDLALSRSPFLAPSGGFTFRLERESGASLFSTHFDMSSLQAGGLGGGYWLNTPPVDLAAANILVTAGDKLRMVLSIDSDTPVGIGGWYYRANGANFTYAGGDALSYSPYGVFPMAIDYGFRTYVDPGSVPEPDAWALMILGFGAVGITLRRKSKGALRTA